MTWWVLSGMRALVWNARHSSPPRSPRGIVSDQIWLANETLFFNQFLLYFRWGCFSCTPDGAFGKPLLWGPYHGVSDGHQGPSTTCLLLPLWFMALKVRSVLTDFAAWELHSPGIRVSISLDQDTRAELGNMSMKDTLSPMFFLKMMMKPVMTAILPPNMMDPWLST